MHQLQLFTLNQTKHLVNIASIPQRSPFRYPGGKTWLVPQIRCWLDSIPTKPRLLIEPFAGGGIVGLTVAFENLADRVLLVELDSNIASVWRVLLNGGADWLADRITGFEMNPESISREINGTGDSDHETAFRTILRNRVSHGGIMAPGAGLIKNGERGKGIASRWYPTTLARRVREIGRVRDRITFLQGDGLTVMREYAQRPDVAFFIDPPYTAAGKKAGVRLYTYNELDHEALFMIAETLYGDFLMTYDNAEGVRLMAEKHNFDIRAIPMKNTHHTEMVELLIGKKLSWVDN